MDPSITGPPPPHCRLVVRRGAAGWSVFPASSGSVISSPEEAEEERGQWLSWRRRSCRCLRGTASGTCCSGTGRRTIGKELDGRKEDTPENSSNGFRLSITVRTIRSRLLFVMHPPSIAYWFKKYISQLIYTFLHY